VGTGAAASSRADSGSSYWRMPAIRSIAKMTIVIFCVDYIARILRDASIESKEDSAAIGVPWTGH